MIHPAMEKRRQYIAKSTDDKQSTDNEQCMSTEITHTEKTAQELDDEQLAEIEKNLDSIWDEHGM